MRKTGWKIVGVGMGLAACAAVASFGFSVARAESLRGLDDQLNGTGRVGTLAPESGHIAPAAADGGVAVANVPAGAREAAPAISRIDGDAAARAGRPNYGGGM